jgi:hypothetical protein
VVDNLMGVTGDTNDPGSVTTVFDGLTRLTNRGVPVVVIHHESEHSFSNPGGPPMGASVIVQKSRTWIQVRQTAKRKLRGGNTALVIQANSLSQPQQLVAEPMVGPNYRVLNPGAWDDGGRRLDEDRQRNDWFDRAASDPQLCHIKSVREIGRKLHTAHPGEFRSEDAARMAFDRAKKKVGGKFVSGRWKA